MNTQKSENGKKSFLIYQDYRTHFDLLDQAGVKNLLFAMFNYNETGALPNLTAVESMAFSFIKSQMDRDHNKWKISHKKRVTAGRKGGKVGLSNAKQCLAMLSNASVTGNVTVTGTGTGTVKRKETPIPPLEKKAEKKKQVPSFPIPAAFSPSLHTALADWLEYKGQNAYKQVGWKSLLKTVTKAVEEHGLDRITEQIDTAIASSWKGMNLNLLKSEPKPKLSYGEIRAQECIDRGDW